MCFGTAHTRGQADKKTPDFGKGTDKENCGEMRESAVDSATDHSIALARVETERLFRAVQDLSTLENRSK